MMRLGGIPFFISCSIIALTGRRRQRNGSVKGLGGGLRAARKGWGRMGCSAGQGEVLGTKHTLIQPRRRWVGSQGSGKEREVEHLPPSQRGRGTQGLSTSPSPKLLTVFCGFLDPSFILGCVRSQPHQIKPGRRCGLSPNTPAAPRPWEVGAACALPRLPQGTGFWLFSPPIPPTPQNPPSEGPPQPCHTKH